MSETDMLTILSMARTYAKKYNIPTRTLTLLIGVYFLGSDD